MAGVSAQGLGIDDLTHASDDAGEHGAKPIQKK
jgi:hypothetical protein